MRKFISHSLLAFIVIALFAIGLDRYITAILCKSEAKLFKSWNEIFEGGITSNAVIMGSSRGLVQYNPAILDSALKYDFYNISIDGRCIDAEIVKYNTYRKFNSKPRLIIQNVDWSSMSKSNGYEREQFLPYLKDSDFFNMVNDSEGFSRWDKYLPLVRYAGYYQVIKEGLKLPNKLPKPQSYKGFYRNDSNWDGREFEKLSHLTYAKDTCVRRMFEDYLAKCREENVQVVFVFAPIYIGVTEIISDVDSMFEMYYSIADKYKIPVLNYTYSSVSKNTDNFYNAMHLNGQGADLFSRELALGLDSLYRNGVIW